ncbi:MAG: sulfurtransferase [Gammaproteobacteria bacterium]|nr:MAG: sulfurtransferase [Gammaproteobacteria bacterium]
MTTHPLPRLIEPAALQAALGTPGLLVVGVVSDEAFQQAHIPGAVHITPKALQHGQPPAPGRLPDAAQLSALFSAIGLTPDTHVVAYDDEGSGWAGRLLWTLAVLGHAHWSCLDGGIIAWQAAGLPVEQGNAPPRPSQYQARIGEDYRISTEQLLQRLDDPGVRIWDARSHAEYTGEKAFSKRGGHIPGAIHLEWTDLMDRSRDLRLLPPNRLRELLASRGFTDHTRIITHCQTHHRSGLTWLAGYLLGLDIVAYDGSWGEWGNREDTPIHNGEKP